jgi:uncharacterized repeat protein (TIGR01451 family)
MRTLYLLCFAFLLIVSHHAAQAQQVSEGLTRFAPKPAPMVVTPEMEAAKQNAVYHPTSGAAGASSRSSDCVTLSPICVAEGTDYILPAGVNQPQAEIVNPGNDYACLGSTPNPAWYYFKIGESTPNLSLSISNTMSVDIDFIVWGPFDDLQAATNNCGSYTSSQVEDCSYSASPTESLDISNPQVGQVYVFLITNFSNMPTNIIVSGGGSGILDCSILNMVTGSVHTDANADCDINGTDAPMPNQLIAGGGHWAMTNAQGNYTLLLSEVGSYPITQVNTNPLVTQTNCTPSYEANFSALGQEVSNFDFYNEVIPCPYLTVDVGSNMRRRCATNNTVVEYCNIGFADANDVVVYVDFPEYVSLVSTQYPYAVTADGNYAFNMGSVAAGECGTIYMVDSVACLTDITGLMQCTEAWITPNNSCAQNANPNLDDWDGSNISLSGVCNDNSSISFTISNTSDATGNMADSSQYRIFADGDLVYDNNFKLDGGTSLTLQLVADGRTYRLEADQRPNHPNNDHPTLNIENCGGSSNWNINALPNNDIDATTEIDCLPIIDSYDPNDKQVSPSGVGNEHFVQPNTLFDYQIRFQNTGSASALKVVVVDTLPAQLDPATLQLGASSHNYNLSIDGYNGRLMLIFTFNGINLPDSTSNLLGSQGFLKFKIAAKADVPLETTISNNAYIYFDYNEPVITNNAWVTIHYFKIDDPIAVTVTPTATPIISIPNDFKLYPNPSKQNSLLDLGKTYENIQVKIETINGQVVYNQQFLQKNQVLLNAEQLNAGIYFVRIITQNQNVVLKWIKQ